MNLFLDDIRDPTTVANHCNPSLASMYRTEKWEIVRNYDEFEIFIHVNGVPDKVSFDHDLADIHYQGGVESFSYGEKTGLECARFLIDYCMREGKKFPEYFVHSQNPVGAENIKCLIQSYLRSNK